MAFGKVKKKCVFRDLSSRTSCPRGGPAGPCLHRTRRALVYTLSPELELRRVGCGEAAALGKQVSARRGETRTGSPEGRPLPAGQGWGVLAVAGTLSSREARSVPAFCRIGPRCQQSMGHRAGPRPHAVGQAERAWAAVGGSRPPPRVPLDYLPQPRCAPHRGIGPATFRCAPARPALPFFPKEGPVHVRATLKRTEETHQRLPG